MAQADQNPSPPDEQSGAQPAGDDLQSGETVILNDRYRLLQRAGTGGMATVFKGQDVLLGRLVAVKILHPSLTHDEAFLRRFQREAHAAANLSHPNIVTVHDIGQAKDLTGYRHYIVMEYVEGHTLKQVVRAQVADTGRPLPIGRALDLAIQICDGIGYAHRANLVHCDVKPQNVLISADDRVKVADFGIARAMTETSIYHQSMLWGTPHYFAPEQAAGEVPSPASDVYAIGVILFEMLTGRLPFEADTLPGLALAHLNEPPPPVTTYNPAVPEQLERIILKVMSKEPAGRYRTAGQMAAILRSYKEHSQEATGPVSVAGTAAAVAGAAAVGEAVSAAVPVALTPEAMTPEMFAETRGTPPVSERQTAVMDRPAARSTRPREAVVVEPVLPEPAGLDEEEKASWPIILLGLVDIILLLGLIPLWLAVFLRWTQ